MNLSEESVHSALKRILASPEFIQSGRMRSLLTFLVHTTLQGKAGQLKESVIGVEVFGRDPGYNPKIDGVVRTEVRRLRFKLQEYYGASGLTDAIRIDLPKGGYVPVFTPVDAPQPAEPPVAFPPIPRRRSRWWWLVPVAGVIATLAWLLGTKLPSREAAVPRQMTSGNGYSRTPAFSYSGDQIAYSADLDSKSHIFVRPVENGAPRQVTLGDVRDYEPAWSPDGSQLAYVRQLSNTYQIRVLNLQTGAERALAEIAMREHLDWSPDGAWLATTDHSATTGPSSVILLSPANGARRALTTPPTGTAGDRYPEFSPNGKQLAFIRGTEAGNEDIYWMDLRNIEAARQLTFEHRPVQGITWLPGGNSLLASLQRGATARSLWRVPIGGGAPERFAEAGIDPTFPAISRNGRRLAWVVSISDTDIWRFPSDGSGIETRVVESPRRDAHPHISPDGKLIAFRSSRTGFDEIWVSDAGGGSARQITFIEGALTGGPHWSPDGKELVFDSRMGGDANIYRVNASGGKPVQLTSDRSNEEMPSWSHNGQWIYFASDRSGQWQIWRLTLATGVTEQVSSKGGFAPLESPDGRYLYYSRGPAEPGIARIPVAGGPEELVVPDLKPEMWGNWAPANGGVYYVDWKRGVAQSSIMFRDPAASAPRLVRTLARQPFVWDAGLALSPDETAIYCSELTNGSSEILLLSPLR